MKITNKDFELYKKEVLKWMDEFKIGGWEVHFGIDEKDEENIAGSEWSLKSKIVTFNICRDWRNNLLNTYEIKKSTLHEVLHLAIAKITTMAVRRYVNRDQVDEAEEEAVNTLINYILKK